MATPAAKNSRRGARKSASKLAKGDVENSKQYGPLLIVQDENGRVLKVGKWKAGVLANGQTPSGIPATDALRLYAEAHPYTRPSASKTQGKGKGKK